MAQSGTVASGGSVDVVVAAYEQLRVYDAGGLVGTLSRQNAGGGFDVIDAIDHRTTGEARGWGGPATFRLALSAGAARYVVSTCDAVGEPRHATIGTIAEAAAVVIPPSVDAVTLDGYWSIGDGGAARYISDGTPSASGAFAGQEGRIAAFEAGVFDFLDPRPGFLAFLRDEGRLALYDGAAWVSPLAASPHRAAVAARVMEEDVALSGAFVETAAAIPARAIVLGVSTRTVAAVAGAASYDCGIAGEPGKFGGSLGIAAGSSNVGVIGPTAVYAPTPVRLTANGGSFSGGTVRVAIHLIVCTAPEA